MTITIEPPDTLAELIAQDAARAGMSVPEYTMRALWEKAGSNYSQLSPSEQATFRQRWGRPDQEARDRARQEAKARIRSGYYVTPGLSSDGLMAERREEARREAEQEAAKE